MRVALFPPFSHQTEHTPTCTVAKILSLSLSLSSRLAPAQKKEKNERRNEGKNAESSSWNNFKTMPLNESTSKTPTLPCLYLPLKMELDWLEKFYTFFLWTFRFKRLPLKDILAKNASFYIHLHKYCKTIFLGLNQVYYWRFKSSVHNNYTK